MIEWRDENDEIKDDERMMKMGNREINNNKRLFEEKRINLKYKKRNRVYTIHGGDYKKKNQIQILTQTPFFVPVLSQVILDSLRYQSST